MDTVQKKLKATPVFEEVLLQPPEGREDGERPELREALSASVHLVKVSG